MIKCNIIRFLDIILSGSALVLLFPILIPIACILMLTGENKIFYMQSRVGRNNRHFNIIKFATMLKDSPNIATGNITLKNDPRVLPFGRFLRKTKINELPQLINVIKGDMCLIGPRPMTPDLFVLYTEETRDQIISVRPGLSGISSIFFRNEETLLQSQEDSHRFYSEHIMPYKGELECWFVVNKRPTLYFKLILATMLVLVFPDNSIWKSLVGKFPSPKSELANRIAIAQNRSQ